VRENERWPIVKSRLEARHATKEEMDKAYADLGAGGLVRILDPATGKSVLPDIKVKDTILGGIAAADHRIYFGCLDGFMRSMATSGGPVKERNLYEPIATSPAIGIKNVYVVTKSGRLIGLDRQTMAVVWQTRLGSGEFSLSSPVLFDGHVYVG